VPFGGGGCGSGSGGRLTEDEINSKLGRQKRSLPPENTNAGSDLRRFLKILLALLRGLSLEASWVGAVGLREKPLSW
jgi:hypothetical protein